MHRILSAPVILFVLVLHVLDLTLAPVLPFSNARILFLYLFILYAAFQWEGPKATPLALIAGFLRDLTSAQVLGCETLSLAACAILLDWISHKLDRKSSLVRGVVCFLFVLTAQTLVMFLSGAIQPEHRFGFPVFAIILRTAIWNAVVTVLFFPLAALWFRDDKPLRQYELFR